MKRVSWQVVRAALLAAPLRWIPFGPEKRRGLRARLIKPDADTLGLPGGIITTSGLGDFLMQAGLFYESLDFRCRRHEWPRHWFLRAQDQGGVA